MHISHTHDLLAWLTGCGLASLTVTVSRPRIWFTNHGSIHETACLSNQVLESWRILQELLLFSLSWDPEVVGSNTSRRMCQQQGRWICR